MVRDKYKVMLLATQYGMAAETLAARLGVSTFEAHEMLNQHREHVCPILAVVRRLGAARPADRMMRTAMGWTCRVGITEFNERSIRNWPVQATGADILRIACILAARHGIRLLAPVHDAVLIEAPIERIEADVALMQEIMRRASRIVLNAEPANCALTPRSSAIPTATRQARRRHLGAHAQAPGQATTAIDRKEGGPWMIGLNSG